MKPFRNAATVLPAIALGLVALVPVVRAAEVSKADVDKALAAVADYNIGKPREPLYNVENLIRQTGGNTALRRHVERGMIGLLESGTTVECKLFLCQQLWVIGTEASVPALGKLLTDEKTAHMACYALGRNPSPKVDEVLRAALARAKASALLAVVTLVGDRRDAAGVPALGELAAGADPLIAEAAIAALGRVGTAETATILAGLRKTAPATLRPVVTDAYLQCAARLAGDGKRDQAVAMYRDVLSSDGPVLYRRGALLGLMNAAGADAVPTVIATLGGDNAMLKAAAIANIPAITGAGVTERFTAELPKLDEDLQVLLVGALVGRDDPAVRPALSQAAESRSAKVSAAALEALGGIGDASSVALLARAVAEGKSDAQWKAALFSLRALRGHGVDAAIVKSMQTLKGNARAQLIQVLSDRGAEEAADALLEEAVGADENVRRAALKALGRLAGPKHVPAMVDLLVGLKGESGREEAETAVVLVSRKIADEASQAGAVLAAMKRTDRLDARSSLLRAVARIAGPKALGAVRTALKDPDAMVQDAAVRALATWPDAAATDVLLEVFRTTKNETHRVLALRGAVRLLDQTTGVPSEATVKTYADLLAHTPRPEEKKLVISGLATCAHPATLDLLLPLATDKDVRAEVGLAAVKVAKSLAASHPAEVRKAMERLIACTDNADLKKQADEIGKQTKQFDDFIMGWQVSGPYVEEGKGFSQLHDAVFAPEKPGAAGARWRVLPGTMSGGAPTVFDLLAILGGEQRVAYVRTWIHSDKAQDARLELGTDDGNKVWLNGTVVGQINKGRACTPGEDKVNLKLGPGWNALLLKVTQNTGPWAFCAKLVRPDGGALEGIRIDCLRN